MILEDKLYGKFEIEDVLRDLIQSKPVQRLKKIHQGGANYLVNDKWNNTRYEHSIGAMCLVRILGGSLEEQIAGLLHDVSHTAFSHVVDLVFENKNEEYHEEIYLDIIQRSEIPEILGKHGFDYSRILNDMHQWTILEKELPDLCADRIDYTLRDLVQIEKITKHDVESFLRSLTIIDGTIALENTKVAEWFVEKYYDLIFNYFQHPKNILAYEFLAKALKIAVEKDILNKSDFEKTDDDVIKILHGANDKEILGWIDKISPNTKVEKNESEYNIYAKRKVRIIDPPVLVDGKIQRLTDVSENIKRMNEEALMKAEKGVYLRIELD